MARLEIEEVGSSQSQPVLSPKSDKPQPHRCGGDHQTVEEMISSLCDQLDRAEDKAQRWAQQIFAERKRAADAERAAAATIEALRPFADLARGVHESWADERRAYTLNIEPLRLIHLRKAKALVDAADAKAERPQ